MNGHSFWKKRLGNSPKRQKNGNDAASSQRFNFYSFKHCEEGPYEDEKKFLRNNHTSFIVFFIPSNLKSLPIFAKNTSTLQ